MAAQSFVGPQAPGSGKNAMVLLSAMDGPLPVSAHPTEPSRRGYTQGFDLTAAVSYDSGGRHRPCWASPCAVTSKKVRNEEGRAGELMLPGPPVSAGLRPRVSIRC